MKPKTPAFTAALGQISVASRAGCGPFRSVVVCVMPRACIHIYGVMAPESRETWAVKTVCLAPSAGKS